VILLQLIGIFVLGALVVAVLRNWIER